MEKLSAPSPISKPCRNINLCFYYTFCFFLVLVIYCHKNNLGLQTKDSHVLTRTKLIICVTYLNLHSFRCHILNIINWCIVNIIIEGNLSQFFIKTTGECFFYITVCFGLVGSRAYIIVEPTQHFRFSSVDNANCRGSIVNFHRQSQTLISPEIQHYPSNQGHWTRQSRSIKYNLDLYWQQ